MFKITIFQLSLFFILQSCVYNQNYKNSAVDDLTSQNPEYGDQIKTHIKESQKSQNFRNNFDNKNSSYSYTIEDKLSSSNSIGSLNSILQIGVEKNRYIHKIRAQIFCLSTENNFLTKPLSFKWIDWKVQGHNHSGEATTDHDGFLNISMTNEKQSKSFKKMTLNYENKDYELILDTLKKEMILKVNCN